MQLLKSVISSTSLIHKVGVTAKG